MDWSKEIHSSEGKSILFVSYISFFSSLQWLLLGPKFSHFSVSWLLSASWTCFTFIQSGICSPSSPFWALTLFHSECLGLTSNASCWGIFLSVFFTVKCAPACCRYLANRSKRHTLAMTNPTAEIPPDLQRQLGQQAFRSRVWPPHLVPDQHRWVAAWAMWDPWGSSDRHPSG